MFLLNALVLHEPDYIVTESCTSYGECGADSPILNALLALVTQSTHESDEMTKKALQTLFQCLQSIVLDAAEWETFTLLLHRLADSLSKTESTVSTGNQTTISIKQEFHRCVHELIMTR